MNEKDLDVDLPPGDREDFRALLKERARILSEVPAAEDSGEKIAALSFQLAGETYGIELKYLAETRRSTPLRRLPGVLPHLAGAMNLRGELIPVVDLGPILGLGRREIPATVAAVLVLSVDGNKLALAVDQFKDILTFAAKELQPPPVSLEPERSIFIRGEYLIDGGLLNLLAVEKILADPRLSGQIRDEAEPL